MIFKDKNVLIMGLGLLGGGLSVANWFIKNKAQVRITDVKTAKQLGASIQKIHSQKVEYSLGGHKEKDFVWADIVVQNPAVSRDSKFLRIARKHGAKIENEATLFFQRIGRENIIAITGTRGKSTTAALTHHILKKKYSTALFGGNIAQSAMFDIVDKAQNTNHPIILELSSWHLENMGDKKISPHIALITNIFPDHLNRYKNIREYIQAKNNIIKYQNKSDIAIVNLDNIHTKKMGMGCQSSVYWFSQKFFPNKNGIFIKNNWIVFRESNIEQKVVKVQGFALKGNHNVQNILAALCLAMIQKAKLDDITESLKRFKGLPHRLEFVKKVSGVQYINDTSATTPDATIAALQTLGNTDKRIVLITGGSDKKIPEKNFQELAKEIEKSCKAIVLFEGIGSDKIKKAQKRGIKLTSGIKNMPEAVGIAQSIAKKGDTILLSPACASFGIFINEFDRGDQFKEIVQHMANEKK